MRKNITLSFAFLFILITSCKKEVSVANDESTVVDTSKSNIERIIEARKKRMAEKKIPADGKYPVITFKETEFDFGDIKQGDKVEHTFDNPFTTASPVAFPHSVLAGISASTDSNYFFPVTAIRLTCTSYTSGSGILTIVQGNS